ncbi:MAG TPA: DUF1775 domain-containing protein [Acidimicrobiales bacterium]|jgi:uncharacterized protein YcnI
MIKRVTVAGLGALALVLAAAAPAFAHVEVQPASASAGAPATFAFRVPNEKDNASTVALAVHFPTDHVITVDVPPKAGWTVQVTMAGDAVDTVTWSGGRIDPGHADYFAVTTGPLPTDVTELTFAADQTYSDGDVVTWNQPEVPGHGEPAHPAPILEVKGGVVPATSAAVAPPASAGPATSAGLVPVTTAGAAPSDDDDAPPVGLVAVAAAAVLALAVGGVVMLRRSPGRRSAHQ